MELDVLKTIWQNTAETQSSMAQLSRKDIHRVIDKKSNTTISKIRRRLKLKFLLQISIGVAGMAMALFLITKGEIRIGIAYLIIFPIVLALGIHKRSQYRMIVNFQESSSPLQATLVYVIEIMNKVIRAQVITSVILGTFFIALILFIQWAEVTTVPPDLQILIFVSLFIAAPFPLYFVAKRSQQKMFGNFIEMLEGYVAELVSTEETQ